MNTRITCKCEEGFKENLELPYIRPMLCTMLVTFLLMKYNHLYLGLRTFSSRVDNFFIFFLVGSFV